MPLIKERDGGVLTPFDPLDLENVRKWVALAQRGGGGAWIGFFERLLFFSAIYEHAWLVVAGWLTLKVASKWESWKVVGDVAQMQIGRTPMDFICARRQWATFGYVSFLVGTLINVVIAYVGVLIAKWPM